MNPMPVKMTINDSFYQKVSEVKMRLAMEKAVKQTMYDLMKESVRNAPSDTGNLRRSHSIEVRLGSGVVEGLLRNSAPYWKYVNFGTSKMEANAFLTRALSTIAPERKVATYFDKFYKGGE